MGSTTGEHTDRGPDDHGRGPDDHRHEPDDFGWSLGALFRSYQESVAAALADVPHAHRGYQILSAVARGDQPSQLSLAGHLGIDRTVMTYLIDDLVGAGLVERRPDPADRRRRRVVLTPAGAQTLTALERRVQVAEDAVLGPLTAGERETLCTLVRRVAREDVAAPHAEARGVEARDVEADPDVRSRV
ncbi:MarR family winged helix-turn-helix transcriptional regulator [Georgenia subflava]|uniref:Winged helix DNA-binding protein n=1 Tax=Georgenia subflava TaxID=1622177 RepID=A0A6N7EEB8_9MICO|nr:MarR family winged helix-turn-helix transcriptional regulator [Georgenia subflava]MPV36772.1 winged helix DNA-binding protein [Georgenia subflava]